MRNPSRLCHSTLIVRAADTQGPQTSDRVHQHILQPGAQELHQQGNPTLLGRGGSKRERPLTNSFSYLLQLSTLPRPCQKTSRKRVKETLPGQGIVGLFHASFHLIGTPSVHFAKGGLKGNTEAPFLIIQRIQIFFNFLSTFFLPNKLVFLQFSECY